MKLKKCPRCDWRAYEKLRTHSTCYDCGFNSAEGYTWAGSTGRGDEERETEVKQEMFLLNDGSTFSASDHTVVRQALMELPTEEREVIKLKFWNGYDSAEIAEELGLRVKVVNECLSRAYAKLKILCMKNPDFSRSALSGLMAAA